MSIKRKRYEISSLPDSDDEDQDDDMDEFNEEEGDWGARAIDKDDDMELKLERALMQKEDRDCWKCPKCNIILNIKQTWDINNNGDCFRCERESFSEDQRIVNYRGQWVTPDRLKWTCLGTGCLAKNKNIRSNQCCGVFCKLFRNPPIGNFIQWAPSQEEIKNDKQFVLIDNELWPRLCRYCGWRSDEKQCIKCKAIKDMDPERIIKTNQIHLISSGYCRLHYEEWNFGKFPNKEYGQPVPKLVQYLIHTFYILLDNDIIKKQLKQEENKYKNKNKQQIAETIKNKFTKTIISEKPAEGVSGTANEHIWRVKVEMKYELIEGLKDIIGIFGNFSIGVVTGERRFFLNGNGMFRNAKGEDNKNYSRGKIIKSGDIITVKLNMTFGTLEYFINEENLGIAWKMGRFKKCRREYKLWIIYKKNEIKCKILDYKVKNHQKWNCKKCTTLNKIKADVCRFCNWSRIIGKTKGSQKLLDKQYQYEDGLITQSMT